jgi:IS5 family transposase
MRIPYHREKPLFSQSSNHKFSADLRVMSQILDEHPVFTQWVHEDLTAGICKKGSGAKGMTSEQVLRAGLIKQMNDWSYEFLEIQCIDSEMTRAFIKLGFDESYSDSCLQSNISRVRGATWQNISDGLVRYGAVMGLEKGRVIRMDSTVIESNIHEPSDSSLMYDMIRTVNQVFGKMRKELGIRVYGNISTKDAKKFVLRIMNAISPEERKKHYKKLLKSCKEMLDRIKKARLKLDDDCGAAKKLDNILELAPRIIDQTYRRVIKEEKVPSTEKIVSVFESHTDIIVKGKRKVEYGHKVFFTSGASGLVLDCQIARGNPSDSEFFMPLIEKQKELYGRAPRQTTADGGFASTDNVLDAKTAGVSDVCFSKRCHLQIEEMVKSKWVFEKLRNFRAGIESLISCLKRAFSLDQVNWKGQDGYAAYVHSAVAAYNLHRLSRILQN